ncbi:MAG: hypothetical protein GY810_19065 [Aureispira sp.]|nr:hypothetical protein [Aureispira sp.]
MKTILSIILTALSTFSLLAQYPSHVKKLKFKALEVKSTNNANTSNDALSRAVIKGNLNEGNTLSSLRFASYSSVACFPSTRNDRFDGNHVFYHFKLPAYSVANIKLFSDKDVSLYGYQVGTNNYIVAPDLNRCVTCEASYDGEITTGKKAQERMRFNSIKNEYNIVIAVAGAKKLKEGDFKLVVRLETNRPEDETIQDTKEASVTAIPTIKGEIKTLKGNLEVGKQIPLDWAQNSNVACFPGTRFESYRGNHVFYTLELPRYSKLKVTLLPKDRNANINIYGFSGHDGSTLPPDIHRCVSCEADYYSDDTGAKSINFMAINNPYKVLIAVAGGRDVLAGEYELKVELTDR